MAGCQIAHLLCAWDSAKILALRSLLSRCLALSQSDSHTDTLYVQKSRRYIGGCRRLFSGPLCLGKERQLGWLRHGLKAVPAHGSDTLHKSCALSSRALSTQHACLLQPMSSSSSISADCGDSSQPLPLPHLWFRGFTDIFSPGCRSPKAPENFSEKEPG